MSLPSRERGLKLSLTRISTSSKRRSLRGSVDWNFPSTVRLRMYFVAPFAGAWIEISAGTVQGNLQDVAPFAGAWIEICTSLCCIITVLSRSLRGSVDWNVENMVLESGNLCRSLRGSVDWNSASAWHCLFYSGRSLRGSVDWNYFVICP